MTFESDYNKLIIYAEKKLQFVNIDNLLATDVVNDAYIFFSTSNIQYTILSAERKINSIISHESARQKLSFDESYEQTGYTYVDKHTEATCCTCKETKPIGLFPYVYSGRHERKKVRNTCLLCVSEQVKKWAKNNPEKFKSYQKEYQKRTGNDRANKKAKYWQDIEKSRELNREKQKRHRNKLKMLKNNLND